MPCAECEAVRLQFPGALCAGCAAAVHQGYGTASAEVDRYRVMYANDVGALKSYLDEARTAVERLRAERPGLALQIKRFDAMLYRAEQAETRLSKVMEAGEYIVEQIDKSDFADGLGHPAKNLDALYRLRAALAAAQPTTQPEEKRHA